MPHASGPFGGLYYEEVGQGHPVIFCHEFAADHRTWADQVRALGRHYRCVEYDSYGYAPSDVPTDPAAYGWEQQRDNIALLMDHLQIESAHLVGLSMGAYSALQFALAYPERATAVAFASGGSYSAPAGRTTDQGVSFTRAERLEAEGWASEEISVGPARVQLQAKDPRGWEQFRAYLHEHPPAGSAMTLRHFQGARPSLHGFEARLEALQTPVLLMVGDEDDAVIELNIFLKRTLPRAGLWMAPRSGHPLNLEEPAAFNAMLLDFFAAVERGGWGARDPRSMKAARAMRGA